MIGNSELLPIEGDSPSIGNKKRFRPGRERFFTAGAKTLLVFSRLKTLVLVFSYLSKAFRPDEADSHLSKAFRPTKGLAHRM